MTDLNKVFNTVVDMTLRYYKDGGETVYPTFHFFSEKEAGIVGAPWSNNEEKEVAINFLKKFAAEHPDYDTYVFVAEGWTSEVSSEDYEKKKYVSPSKDPQRKEVVFIEAHNRDGESKFTSYHLVRGEGNKVVELKETTPCDHVQSNNLLFPPKVVH